MLHIRCVGEKSAIEQAMDEENWVHEIPSIDVVNKNGMLLAKEKYIL